jgi:hypothetical protein
VRVSVQALEPHSRTLGDLAAAVVIGLVGAALLRALPSPRRQPPRLAG